MVFNNQILFQNVDFVHTTVVCENISAIGSSPKLEFEVESSIGPDAFKNLVSRSFGECDHPRSLFVDAKQVGMPVRV